jgi:pseudouridine synthase
MRGKPQAEQKRRVKALERVLSKAGIGSRTDARTWIACGKVRVNGRIVLNPEHWIDLDRDRIIFKGKPLRSAGRIYILLYKPEGYLTSYGDPENRPTVYDLVKDVHAWLAPVGRLDLDTSGLLLMTNDNDFAERITNPAHEVGKTYQLRVAPPLTDDRLQQLRQGVELSDGRTRPAGVKRLRDTGKYSFLELTITEGRNRQVRRMIEALGGKVLKLTRVAIGPIGIDGLSAGQWRHLTAKERKALGLS